MSTDRDTGRSAFTAAKILEAGLGRLLHGDPRTAARGISTDTRRLEAGQAFFALEGPRHDGHDYLEAAEAAGATVVVVHRLPEDWRPLEGTAVILCSETREALLSLAAWHRRRLAGQVIAITGSYGKSTVKDMLGAILGRAGACTAAPSSYNNRIGVSLSLLSAHPEDDSVVLEMGTNHPGEIDELARAARPDLGLITAIGRVHLEGLGDLEGVRRAKAELIPHLRDDGTLALNADDERCRSLSERFAGRTLTFGLSEEADVRPQRIHATPRGWRFDALGWVFELAGGARHNVLNAAAAICAARALGVPEQQAARALADFRPRPLRYEKRQLGGVTFICDCYNSNPPAMRSALRSFLQEQVAGRRILVCGDMLELGQRAPALHRQLGRRLAEAGIDVLVAVGPLSRHVIEGWHRRSLPRQCALHFASAEQAWGPLWWELSPGDAVLLKGSRAMELETIVERIAQQLDRQREEAA